MKRLHQNFLTSLLHSNITIAAMGKSKEKRVAKPDSRKKSEQAASSFIKVDKAAFDPTLASLFASSVRLPLRVVYPRA